MYDYEFERYQQSRQIDARRKSTRADALLLGVLLSFVDLMVLPALGSANGVGELIVSVGLAITLTAGAVLSFRSALRWNRAGQIGEKIEYRPVAAEEAATLNFKSRAA